MKHLQTEDDMTLSHTSHGDFRVLSERVTCGSKPVPAGGHSPENIKISCNRDIALDKSITYTLCDWTCNYRLLFN